MPTFKPKEKIGSYSVSFHIKDGLYAETYRVKDERNKNYFLKLFHYAKLHRSQFDSDGNVLEISIAKSLHHPTIVAYHDSGELIFCGVKYAYLVCEFISGETLAQKMAREHTCSVYEAKSIILDVLEGVKYLHTQDDPIIHNELTIQNVMLDLTSSTLHPVIIDLGYARYLSQGNKSYYKEGLSLFSMAPEAFNGIFTIQSDIYSMGVMLYSLLFGTPPHYLELSRYMQDRESLEDTIRVEQKKPIKIPNMNLFELDEQLINIMGKAMAFNPEDRFKSIDEFISALKGKIKVDTITTAKVDDTQAAKESKAHVRKGNGFKDVIGMAELKERLQYDVIDLLAHPEEAKSWGIDIPNGMLFYGPPGCGKTYFAEKFAEEAGCNFISAHCSDVASPYIHGGQTKIAELFKEARENAPTILFLDEIEAMLTDRGKQNNVSESGEVNEFLAQLNNCGKDGVIVIGATNIPTQIDKAALRSGRLELKYYIPQPDQEARKGLFQLYLKQTKVDFGMDYEHLASITNNYVSSEIKFIVDEAVRLSRRQRLRYVTMDVLESIIKEHKPDLSTEDIKRYEKIRDEFEGKQPERRRIGFC